MQVTNAFSEGGFANLISTPGFICKTSLRDAMFIQGVHNKTGFDACGRPEQIDTVAESIFLSETPVIEPK